jgi:hypothetical protein
LELTYSQPKSDFSKTNTLQLRYDSQVANSAFPFQIWRVDNANVAPIGGATSAFYLKYTAVSYDTNNGQNYPISGVVPPVTATVIATSTARTSTTTARPTQSGVVITKVVQPDAPKNGKMVQVKKYSYNTKTGMMGGTLWVCYFLRGLCFLFFGFCSYL